MSLEVTDLHVRYGVIEAVKGITFDVQPQEIVTLIGANGAGKTSVLKAVSGLLKTQEGSIRLEGQDITRSEAEAIVRLGLAHVPEGRLVFTRLSVAENLEMGAFSRKNKADVSRDIESQFQLFPRLGERRRQPAGTLSGGEQQMLAIARGLMSRPRYLLLDEPSMGLAPLLVQEIFQIIRRVREQGTTILLVEQNASMALKLADRAVVLETGRIAASGPSVQLLNSPEIRKAYLGG